MSIRNRLHVSDRVQASLVRVLQAVMVAIFAVGLYIGNPGIAVNAAVGLLVTFLPAVLERRYHITMDVALVLWITIAMFLHALGTVPLPGIGFLTPYKALWWWDHMTHALSSSLVVGSAYAVTRALQEHTEYINMGPKFTFAYLLVFVMAFGVFWELVEFYIAVTAELVGIPKVLTQYGLEDTVLDLFYNTMGGLLVAVFGTAHLSGISDELLARFQSESANR
ncbi:hypothetical protein [Halorussus caseinilyticus]|uniref:DUF2238 domain-containing protein n=1 Tax=Halorussus caseinilyticus TaxID=3034025 RepID=A0ABD5WFF2_9EURY|nr:hypothetical protein [Halorussus sp. DT72]